MEVKCESCVTNCRAGSFSALWKVISRCHEHNFRMGRLASKQRANLLAFEGSCQHVREAKTTGKKKKKEFKNKGLRMKMLQRAEENLKETIIDNLREWKECYTLKQEQDATRRGTMREQVHLSDRKDSQGNLSES